MTLFKDILNEMHLLNEEASINDINSAINGLHPVWITYDDEQGGGGKNRRQIFPVAYGISTAGNPVIRAYQPQGSTKRGVPKWKLFRLDRIKFWRTINSKTYSSDSLVGFNEKGDEQIETLYSIAPIGKAKEFSKIKDAQKTQPITSKPITKNDIEQVMGNTPNLPKTNTAEPSSNANYTANNAINDILTQVAGRTIDNQQNKNYIKSKTTSKTNAPDTEPISKEEIPGGDKQIGEKEEEKKNNAINTTSPVKKDDLKGTEELTSSYKDMINRMNNLYKEDEEEN